jgi:hypothetical protein
MNMKKIPLIIVLLACVCAFSRCSEDAYTEKYTDPNKITDLLMEKVMTGVFVQINGWTQMGYSRYYSYDNLYLSNFTQSFGRPYAPTMYYNGWSDDGSSKYSGLLSATGLFRKLEMMYNELIDAEKPLNEAYYIAAKTHLYAFLLAMVDLYGDIPFTQGGMVAATGDLSLSNAHFDKAEDLYKMIITDLLAMGERFAVVEKPKYFTASADFVNDADLAKWQRYANSLCLRAAMRVATQGDLTTVGRDAIKKILGDPDKYPIVEDNNDNIVVKNRRDMPGDETGGRGLDDGDGSSNCASDDMLSRMLSHYDRTTWSGSYQEGADDPRAPLLYALTVKKPNTMVGYPSYEDDEGVTHTQTGVDSATVFRGHTYEMSIETANSYTIGAQGISLLRHNGLFWNNGNFDNLIITASEMWFIKAEACLNDWYGKSENDAKEAFIKGVTQSIELFFNYHNSKANEDDAKGDDGKSRRGWVIDPGTYTQTGAWIEDFATQRWENPINNTHPYENKLDAVMTQKYISHSIFFVQEAWNDIRRTGYPKIHFPKVSDANRPNVPVRLRYPVGERDFNKNFSEVNRPGYNADDFYTPLFWAKK